MLALILSLLMASAPTAMAADFLEDPIIYGFDYYTGYVNAYEVDNYKLVVLSSGTLVFTAYNDNGESISAIAFKIISSESGKTIETQSVFRRKDNLSLKQLKFTIDPREHILQIGQSLYVIKANYGFKVEYNFDNSTRAKVTSPSVGKITITAPRGSNVDGFEIRYKKESDSNRTYKTIENNEALKTYQKIYKVERNIMFRQENM